MCISSSCANAKSCKPECLCSCCGNTPCTQQRFQIRIEHQVVSHASCISTTLSQHMLAYSKSPSSNVATCAKTKVNTTVRKLDTTCYHTAITGANRKLHKSDTNADAVRVRRNDNNSLESSRSSKLKPCLTLPSNFQVCMASNPELVNIPCKGIDYAGTHKLVYENICSRHYNGVLQ